MTDWTLDRPTDGVVIAQPRRGFRYGCEAFWLTGFASEGQLPGRALDVGTGSGIAAMLLAIRGVQSSGWDLRPEWAPLWACTVRESRFSVELRLLDVRDAPPGEWPLVVSNPPFFGRGSGPAPSDPWLRAARFEDERGYPSLISAICAQAAPSGRVVLVIPVDREAATVAPAAGSGFAVARRVRVGRRRVLLELARGATLIEDEALTEEDPRVKGWYPSSLSGDGSRDRGSP
jgi:tRNA1(Val) A37 N6-methylase TrmN6